MYHPWLLLAKRDLSGAEPVTWRRLQQQWRLSSDGLMAVEPLIAVAVVLVVLLLIRLLWRRGKLRRLQSEPIRIFYQAIDGLGLSHAEAGLLVHIAQAQQLPTPLTLMLSQATFDYHINQHTQALIASRRTRLKAKTDRIRRILFTDPNRSDG